MDNMEQILAAIGTFAIGWKCAKIYTENKSLPFYDTITQEIYEEITSKYSQYINSSKKPLTWEVENVNINEKQKIRPKREANKLDEAITSYKQMIETLQEYQSDEINIYYKNIIENIVELFESIKIKHNEQPESTWLTWWNIRRYPYYFNYRQLAPRLDGPELMFFTEIAEFIIGKYKNSNDYKDIEKRTKYISFVSNGKIDSHRKTDNDIVTTTIDFILEQYKCLEAITKARDLNKNIPEAIGDMLRSIEFLNIRSLHLTYCLFEGSKRDFDNDEFLKNNLKEAKATNTHSLGTKLNKALELINMNDVYNTPYDLKRDDLDKILNKILLKVEQNDPVLKKAKTSGIKNFFSEPQQIMHIYNCTIDILRDIFRLYFYSRNLRIITNVLNHIGVNWMVTNQLTKLSIETQLKITQFTFERLLKKCDKHIKQYDTAIKNHRLNNNKKNDDPIYTNVHNAITTFNELLISDNSMVRLLKASYTKIISLIKIKNSDIKQINEEKKEVLMMWYKGALESISLESDVEQEKYTEVKQQLQNALNELSNNINTENNDLMPGLITDTLTFLNKPDSEIIEEAQSLDEEHAWKSNVLKEIFENVSWGYNPNSKKFMNFCNKIKKTIFDTETNTKINAICLIVIETILRNFVKKHEKTCYRSPPIYIQPLQAINITGEKNTLKFINDQEQLSIQFEDKSKLELLGLQAQYIAELSEQKELDAEFKALQDTQENDFLNQPLRNNA